MYGFGAAADSMCSAAMTGTNNPMRTGYIRSGHDDTPSRLI